MLAIIPARGGSKGLPGKNIKLLDGIPLIAHTINAAKNAKSVTRIIVSTDDESIAFVAREHGAEVPFLRPSELAEDDSMVMDTYLYIVDRVSEETLQPVDSFVALLPTVPLRNSVDIDQAINIFKQKKADSVISITDAPVPIQWYRKLTEEGTLTDYYPEFDATLNRQVLEKSYIPNGAIYIFKTEKLRSTRQYYNDRTYPYFMTVERSPDIDTLHDFEWIEFLLNKN